MSVKRVKNDKIGEEIDFCWGKKRGRGGANKAVQFYESFRFDGVEYSLYDSVYLFKGGENEPYVGKLLKIWEPQKNDRKVKVLWFFRPSEISNYLEGVDVLENELFLATGEGRGLTNINPLEAIAGKCNVVCISKDSRNRQPSVEELEMADYVFYRTFDVQKFTVSDKLDEKIAMVDVKLLLNKNDLQPADLAKLDSVNVAVDVAKPLISAKDTRVADSLADCDTIVTKLVEPDELTTDFVALPKGHLSEKLGTAVSDNTVLVADVEEKAISYKDTQDIVGGVTCDAGLGSLMVEEDKQSKEEGDAAKADNMSVVPFTSKQVLEIGPKTTSKSSELNEDGKGAVTVTATGNGKSEPVNDVKKRIVAGGNKSEARLSEKLNVDSSARKTIGGGGISTQKSVNVSPASIKVSKPAGNAAETIDGGKLTRESVGISDTLPRKQKYDVGADEKSSDKCNLASGKQSKDLQNIVDKAPQHPGGAAADSNDKRKLSREQDGTNEGLSKKRRTNSLIEHKPNDKLGEVSIKRPNDGQIGACNQVKEVTQRPLDKSKWFTASPWEDRMKDAYDQERLVLLQNLDPTYSSSEVENIVWNGFGESCTVKLVQCTATSSPHSGQAFAIFNTREVAQKVIGKLERDCLMLPNGRPLVGTNDIMSLPGKLSQYFGHLVLDKPKLQMQKEMKEAVSTSHAAQSNTLEYEMALDWILLQDRSDMWWKLLYQKQGEDMRKLKASLKSK